MLKAPYSATFIRCFRRKKIMSDPSKPKTLGLSDSLYKYMVDHSLREHECLKNLREETLKHKMYMMMTSPDEGQFLGLLTKLTNAKRCLEVGVFTGYSSLSVALALPQDGKIVALDVSEEFTSVAKRYWKEAGVDHKIDLRLAPAVESLDKMLDNGEADSFDMAFIDADKGNYSNYYERCLKLVRKGGVIAVDNTLWGGSVANPEDQTASTVAIRALNERIHNDDRVEISMLSIADGVTLAMRVK